MTKKIIYVFIIIFSIKLCAQDKRINILGKVKNDSLLVENVHIINKNSHKGTVSNQFGEFQIPVKVNDTLIFSAIQFGYKELVISVQVT